MSRHRGFVFTWNNYPPDYETTLDTINCRYIVAGEEVAPTTGTPHLQGYLYLPSGKTVSAARRILPGAHIEPARGSPKQADDYCRKGEGKIYSRGVRPKTQEEKGAQEKQRWEDTWKKAKEGKIEEIDADIRVRQYATLRKIERDFMPTVGRLLGPCGVWIWGAAGSGKTRSVLDRYPEAYPKPRSKWWDGYQGEKVVYCDDVDVFNVSLGGEFKLWADAYPFIGEVKGGSKKIRPEKFIVTSQYRIEDIWTDQQTREALLRRFVVIEKKIEENIIF
jgi:hypothetical protein